MPTYCITVNKIYHGEENKCSASKHMHEVVRVDMCSMHLSVWLSVCVSMCDCTSLTLCIIGCSQSALTSQWLSRKVKIEAEAVLAPRTRDRIRPEGNTWHWKSQTAQMDTVLLNWCCLMQVLFSRLWSLKEISGNHIFWWHLGSLLKMLYIDLRCHSHFFLSTITILQSVDSY